MAGASNVAHRHPRCCIRAIRKQEAGGVAVPAPDVEQLVLDGARTHLRSLGLPIEGVGCDLIEGQGQPKRAIATFAAKFKRLGDRGLLKIDDPDLAATQFNWLIIGEPLNRAMLLGDDAIRDRAALRRHAAAGVRVFLTSYGT